MAESPESPRDTPTDDPPQPEAPALPSQDPEPTATEQELVSPTHEPEEPAETTEIADRFAQLQSKWESEEENGSVYEEDQENTSLARFVCDVNAGTLNHKPFKNFWNSKNRCANMLGIGTTTFSEFLVSNTRVQEIVKEYVEHIPNQGAPDKVRGDSFKTFFDAVRDDQHQHFLTSYTSDIAEYSTDDWSTRFHAKLYHEMRVRPGGFLKGVVANSETLWAITYCVAKLAISYNRDEKKKKGALKQIAKSKNQTASNRANMRKSNRGLRMLGPNMDTRPTQAKIRNPNPTERKKKATKGVGTKAPHQPPKSTVDAADDPNSSDVETDDGDIREAGQFKTDYSTLTDAKIIESFVGEQDAYEKRLKAAHQARMERHGRDLDKCMQDLRADSLRHRQYKQLSRVLRKCVDRLFLDFRHEDVTEEHFAALEAMGTPDDIHPTVPGVVEVNDVPNAEQTNEALAGEDALLHEASRARARAKAKGKVIHLDLPEASADHRETAKKWTAVLTGKLFQPDYLKEACIEVHIQDFKFKIIPRQNPAIRLRWWQVINVKWNHDHADGIAEGVLGGLTADQVGTGKTIEISGTILHDMNRVDGLVDDPIVDDATESAPEQPTTPAWSPTDNDSPNPTPDDPEPSLPKKKAHQFYVVLTNPGLVNQTASEIAGYSPLFRVVALGGTNKRLKDGKRIRSNLGGNNYFRTNTMKDPLYFNPEDAETGHTIAIASYLWYARKYGPKAYHKWLREHHDDTRTPKDGEWDKVLRADWERNMTGLVRAVLLDEAADGLRNPSTFWFASYYMRASRVWLFTGSPAPRGIKDYLSYLELIQKPGFNDLAKQSDPSIEYIAGKTDPYDLPNDHPAAKFRAAHYCFNKFIVSPEMDEFERGIKAQLCLQLWVIRRDQQSACPYGSENTIARSLPPKDHFIIEKLLSPTGLRYYNRFAQPWSERLMLMRKDPDRPDEEGTPTPNGRSIRALEMLSFFWPLGFLHKDLPVPKEVRDQMKKGIYPRDMSILNRDRESFFWDKSPIFKKMPKLSKEKPGQRLRWLFKTIQERERKKGSKDKVFDGFEFDDMSPKDLATLFISYSPKMAAVLSLVQHHAVLRDEKMILWFQYPFNQELAQDTLWCLGMSPMAMYKESSAFSRSRIQARFNDPNDTTRILLAGVRVGGTGLNLQYDSHIAVSIDSFTSLDQQVQTEGRQHRNGQVVTCTFYQIVVGRTHDMKIMQENIQNSIASAVALMGNLKQFHPEDDIIPESEVEYANKWQDGYFASRLEEETQSKAFHLATYSGQRRIEDIRDESGDEGWEVPESDMLSPDQAVALLSIQHRSQFVQWHGSSSSTKDFATLVDKELRLRAIQRLELGELSEDDQLPAKKRGAGKKKGSRNEGSTQVEGRPLDPDYDFGKESDEENKDDAGGASTEGPTSDEGDEDAEHAGLDENGFDTNQRAGKRARLQQETGSHVALPPKAKKRQLDTTNRQDVGSGSPGSSPIATKKRPATNRISNKSDSSGVDTEDPPRKRNRVKSSPVVHDSDDESQLGNPIENLDDLEAHAANLGVADRLKFLRDNDPKCPPFPVYDNYAPLTKAEKSTSTKTHKEYCTKWDLAPYAPPRKPRSRGAA